MACRVHARLGFSCVSEWNFRPTTSSGYKEYQYNNNNYYIMYYVVLNAVPRAHPRISASFQKLIVAKDEIDVLIKYNMARNFTNRVDNGILRDAVCLCTRRYSVYETTTKTFTTRHKSYTGYTFIKHRRRNVCLYFVGLLYVPTFFFLFDKGHDFL